MADEILLADLEARKSFLTLPGERVLFAKRKHRYVLFLRIFTTSTLGLFFLLSSFFVFILLFPHITLFIASLLTVCMLTLSLLTRIFVDWYCHLYIVTTRKILEVCISPLFFDRINEILLDQVRCTEVDVQRSGILKELFDVGNIVITFDRPTHQQEFTFADIEDSERAGIYLSDILVARMGKRSSEEKGIWFREKIQEENGKHQFRFSEEIFPGEVLGFN